MSRLRRPIGVGLLSVGSVLAAVLAGELLLALTRGGEIRPFRLRLLDPNIAAENYLEYGQRVPFRLRSNYTGTFTNGNAIHTDSRGLRLDGHRIDRTANVLALGDSFTFGYLLADDQTYPAALQVILDRQRPGWLVANGGYAGGFTFDGAYVRYRDDLWTLKPDLVIYGVFENDYSDFSQETWTKVDPQGYPLRIRQTRDILAEEAYRYPLLRELRLFVGLSMQWRRFRLRGRLGDGSIDWNRVETAVRGFAEATHSHGARLVVVFLEEPYGHYTDYIAAHTDDTTGHVRAENAASKARLQALLDRYGVEWLDDGWMIAQARASLKRGEAPKLMACFSPQRKALLATVRAAEPDELLAADDGTHYSWLANILLSQWLYRELLLAPPTRPAQP
jgi:lysophospholipase L1-like esterase